MDNEVLRKYAELIVKAGANVQPGQGVVIGAELDQPEFVEMVVEEAYRAGASKVMVEWSHMPITKLGIQYQSAESLGTVEKWQEEKMKYRVENLPATIYIESDDPDGLNGIDQEKWAKAQQMRYKVMRPYRDAMENKYQWTIAAVPGKKWARKVFPGLSDDEAMAKLWDAILTCSRALGDPIKNWDEHNEDIRARCDYLNALELRRLKYKSANGTDFEVGLMPEALFLGGQDELPSSGIRFDANIPSEEVFITPRKGDCEGIVYSTRPLSYRGVLIENFSIRFENGRAVEVHAGKNEDALKQMIAMDEGACMLGECALVPYHSPIRESGILFYNTLFDENAACHLALGMGYTSNIKDFDKYTLEELRAMGVNDSMIHEDFMIGSEDLDITGITADGSEVAIFRGGDWAF